MALERMSQSRNNRMPMARAFSRARVEGHSVGARPTGRPMKMVAPAMPPSSTTCASDTTVILGSPNNDRQGEPLTMRRTMAKILLLDGNSLAYRAFFALPTNLATASGQVTNAVFGFTSMLINLLKDHKPDGIGVAFDRPEPTFRHELVPDYKAGRAEAPDILRQQMGLIRQVVQALEIPVLEVPGFEADDIVATLATQARDRGDDAIIVTGDRDTYQLVEDPHVKVL